MYHESERELQDRIAATRERLGETVERIGDKLNPDRVQHELKARAREQVDEFKANVKRKARSTMRGVEHGVSSTGRGVWETIKDNPVPAGMIGVGLAWLAANSMHRDEHERGERTDFEPQRTSSRSFGYSTFERERGARQGFGGGGAYSSGYVGESGIESEPGTFESVPWEPHEEEPGLMHQAQERGMEAVDRVREKGSEVMHRAEERMHHAREGAHRVEHRVEESVHENPFAAGAIAAALGFAAGMIIPESRKEHEVIGPAHDRFMDRAGETVRRAGEKARETVRETAAQSARRAVDEVWPGGHEEHGISEPRR